MISFLSGHTIAGDTVLVGGVGYAVFTPAVLPVGQDVELWVHTVVRETEISLYGFASQAERALFVCLMKVTGVGPRYALALLSLGSGPLAAAIAAKDAKAMSKAPGVGPKKAADILAAVKIPPELLAQLSDGSSPAAPAAPADELLATLVSLGHDETRALDALVHARANQVDAPPPLVLRRALQVLAGRPTILAG